MGWRYVSYRAQHELMKKSGLLKRKFPVTPAFQQYVTLDSWQQSQAHFFFASKESIRFPKIKSPALRENFENIRNGKLLLFNSVLTDLGTNYDWVTNPDSGFRYDVNKHWTDIPDYSKEAGDIKFVWEKSRFSYLYDIIRYDYNFDENCAGLVFADILSWIKNNPVNCGPNYRCSQEMSLRVLNWTFALYYYKNAPELSPEVFDQIQYAIYWHMHHVYNNIDFSRIAVRNNHAITETLTLYLAGVFFPSMPGAAIWKKKGKAWFEEEIAYQVYEDGTFLQFSMNYHRVVVQLLTWAITLSEKNGERFNELVYDRAGKSLTFLNTCMVPENGWLPNYGANDGALFFKLSDTNYRDYRPQLQALALALGIDIGLDGSYEDASWYGSGQNSGKPMIMANGIHEFPMGGYYIIREQDSLTFIKCGGYKDRPSQADNLHLDIWYKGENLLLDAGSYKYNTEDSVIRYFSGTQSHNTVMIDGQDQMLKGGRFIWYYWTKRLSATLKEENDSFVFSGSISAFRHIGKGIIHQRTISKRKDKPEWTVHDEILNAPAGISMRQLWHLPATSANRATITAKTQEGLAVQLQSAEGWASSLYARKENTSEVFFDAPVGVIDSIIKIDNH